MKLKSIAKSLVPPIIISAIKWSLLEKNKDDLTWKGNYKQWSEAKKICTGYDNQNILEACRRALHKVKSGQAVYERDSILFDKMQYSWPILSILQKIALENNNTLTVVDFGGSLGSTYFQNKDWLKNIDIKWIVVEQKHFVEIGQKEFQNNILIFEKSLAEAFKYQPNIILFSSVLQYIENPIEIIKEVEIYGIDNILIDRTGVCNTVDKDIITVQTVPEQFYKASYPCRFFNEHNFISSFSPSYNLIADFTSYCDPSFQQYGITFNWKGFFFNKSKLPMVSEK